jgi:hypothetical protein
VQTLSTRAVKVQPGASPSLTTLRPPKVDPIRVSPARNTINAHDANTPKSITLAALVENGCRPPIVGPHMSLDGLRDAFSREKKNEIA